MADRKETNDQPSEPLNELEQLLASFPPRQCSLKEGEVMYQAGWAAAFAQAQQEPAPRRRADPESGWTRATTVAASLAGAFGVAAALLLAVLVNRPVRVVERIVHAPGADVVVNAAPANETDTVEAASGNVSVTPVAWPLRRTVRDRQLAVALADSRVMASASAAPALGASEPYHVLRREWLQPQTFDAIP